MKSTKKAFTLVELIVVIVILAILGTIAFISLQGHSADARNTKRTTDLSSINSAIMAKNAQATPLMSFVVDAATNKLTALNLSWTGLTATELSNNYAVWAPNYTALGIREDDFKDPNDSAYVVGVTTKVGGVYELAATMEDGETPFAATVGTYTARSNTSFSADNVSSVNTTNTTLVLIDSAANFFKDGDTITDDGGTTSTTITKVSDDGLTLTVASLTNLDEDSEIELVTTESTGLIGDPDSLTNPVVNEGTTYLPY